MLKEATSSDFVTILSTTSGLRVVTRCFLEQGILGPFGIAREMAREDRTKGLQHRTATSGAPQNRNATISRTQPQGDMGEDEVE